MENEKEGLETDRRRKKSHPHSSIFPFLSTLRIASNAQCTFTTAGSQSGFSSWAQMKSSVSRALALQAWCLAAIITLKVLLNKVTVYSL